MAPFIYAKDANILRAEIGILEMKIAENTAQNDGDLGILHQTFLDRGSEVLGAYAQKKAPCAVSGRRGKDV